MKLARKLYKHDASCTTVVLMNQSVPMPNQSDCNDVVERMRRQVPNITQEDIIDMIGEQFRENVRISMQPKPVQEGMEQLLRNSIAISAIMEGHTHP